MCVYIYIHIHTHIIFKVPVTSTLCGAAVAEHPAAKGLVDAPTATFAGCRAADTKFLAHAQRQVA